MTDTLEGGCSCGEVRYRLASAPMFVHCCHCLNCQKHTGTAFVINLLIEASRVKLLGGNAATGHHAAQWRQPEQDLPLPEVPGGGLERVRRTIADPVRARRDARRLRPPCRRTCTSTPARSSPGSRSPLRSRPSRSTTIRRHSGPRRARSAARPRSRVPERSESTVRVWGCASPSSG